jgi:hypothetical protein
MIYGDYIRWNIYTYIAGIIILLASHGYVYFKGKEHGLERYYDLKSSVEAAQKRAEEEAQRQKSEQDRIARETTDGWAAAVAWYRDHPRIVRVLQSSGCVSQTGAVSASTEGTDATAAQQRPSTIELTAEQCEFRVNNAILDAAQVIHLQNWIKQQYEASK